eukprot:2906110-Amphidinium_carterae.1
MVLDLPPRLQDLHVDQHSLTKTMCHLIFCMVPTPTERIRRRERCCRLLPSAGVTAIARSRHVRNCSCAAQGSQGHSERISAGIALVLLQALTHCMVSQASTSLACALGTASSRVELAVLGMG